MSNALTLGEKQRIFVYRLSLLVQWAYENGYELTLGDAYRDPRVHGQHGEKKSYSSALSNHKIRLAQDYNLFKDGVYLDKTEDHKPLGEYWESLGHDCAWGGRFKDGNHYSMEHQGRK